MAKVASNETKTMAEVLGAIIGTTAGVEPNSIKVKGAQVCFKYAGIDCRFRAFTESETKDDNTFDIAAFIKNANELGEKSWSMPAYIGKQYELGILDVIRQFNKFPDWSEVQSFIAVNS